MGSSVPSGSNLSTAGENLSHCYLKNRWLQVHFCWYPVPRKEQNLFLFVLFLAHDTDLPRCCAMNECCMLQAVRACYKRSPWMYCCKPVSQCRLSSTQESACPAQTTVWWSLQYPSPHRTWCSQSVTLWTLTVSLMTSWTLSVKVSLLVIADNTLWTLWGWVSLLLLTTSWTLSTLVWWWVCLSCRPLFAPLGAADAEIRFLSAENPEMSKVSPSFIGGTGQNTGMHASSTAKCQIILVFWNTASSSYSYHKRLEDWQNHVINYKTQWKDSLNNRAKVAPVLRGSW